MTAISSKVAALAAIAAIGFVGLAYSDSIQISKLGNETRAQLGAKTASEVVRCIMPAAWQRDCHR